ncbi:MULTISPECIES: hypothetical protein [unclassified Rhizobium]|uniref:hypothetical protein n=1 Tax=unclassified Rhizobium TaxID=2613769 RepID=UPI0027DE7C28|nr:MULTISPECIES: hypothetical protein [unclassified Rhizobium]
MTDTGNKPPRAGMGRPQGALNKTTAALKEAILNPGPFMTLLGKVLPLQIGGDPENPLITRPMRDLTDDELTAIIIAGQKGGRSQ